MKRKSDELLARSPRNFKIASNVRGTITPSSYVNHEVSDPRASVAQNEISSIGDQAIEYRERNGAYSKEIIPNEADGNDTSQGLQLLNDEGQKRSDENIETIEENSHGLIGKIEKDSDQILVSNTFIMEDDSLDEKFGTSIENCRGLVEKNRKEMPQTDSPKTPIITKQTNVNDENVNKNQNRSEEKNALMLDRINFRKSPIKSDDASSNFKAKKPVATQIEKRETLQKTSSNPVIKPPPIKTQPDKIEIDAPKDQASEDNTKPTQIEEPLADEKSKLIETVEEIKVITKNEQELGKMLANEEPNQNKFPKLLAPQESICHTSEDSIGKIEHDIKQIKESAVKHGIEERLSRRFSVSENVDKDIKKTGIYTDVNTSGKIKSSDESSPEPGAFPGPFGQAIKIAIIIAFGSLVLLTRQRKPSAAVKRDGQCEKRNRWEG